MRNFNLVNSLSLGLAAILVLSNEGNAASIRSFFTSRRTECVVKEVHVAVEADQVPPIAPWSFRERNLKLSPSQILPLEYIHNLESEIGPLSLEVEHTPMLNWDTSRKLSVSIAATSRSSGAAYPVAKFDFQTSPRNKNAMIVENLRLSNPLAQAVGTLHLSQNQKGLPGHAFVYFKNQVFKAAAAAGYREIESAGAQNYTVEMMYRRTVGFKKANPEGKAFTAYLDGLFKFAKKELPPGYQVRSLDDFSRILGDVNHSSISPHTAVLWDNYLKTGTTPSTGFLWLQREGAIIGFIDEQADRDQSKVFFLDPKNPKTILQWSVYAQARAPELELHLENPYFSSPPGINP